MPARPGRARAPKKALQEHLKAQAAFKAEKLGPVLEQAEKGEGHVLFADAAHRVYGSFLCRLWALVRLYVRAASGRQRFNILGARDAVTRGLVSVTNTTAVNALTMCELLGETAALGLAGPVTGVLDNARYQKCAGDGGGGEAGDNALVPAELLAEPEPDRAALAAHQEGRAVRPLAPDGR